MDEQIESVAELAKPCSSDEASLISRAVTVHVKLEVYSKPCLSC